MKVHDTRLSKHITLLVCRGVVIRGPSGALTHTNKPCQLHSVHQILIPKKPSRECGLKFRRWHALVPPYIWCQNANRWTQCTNCAWRYGSIDFISNPIWSTAQIARIIYNLESVWLNNLQAAISHRKQCLCVKGGNATRNSAVEKLIIKDSFFLFNWLDATIPWSKFVKWESRMQTSCSNSLIISRWIWLLIVLETSSNNFSNF